MIIRRKNRSDSKKWRKRDLFRWLEYYEFMTKQEFKELPKYKQENYITEFEMFQMGVSQYNKKVAFD